MTQILIQGAAILAQGPFTQDDENIEAPGIIFPKHILEDWLIVDVDLPPEFDPILYCWDGAALAKQVEPVLRAVPEEITMRQAQQALAISGLLDQVQPLIDAIPDPLERTLAQIEWTKSQTLKRGRPLVLKIGAGLGLTPDQQDDMLVFANTLP